MSDDGNRSESRNPFGFFKSKPEEPADHGASTQVSRDELLQWQLERAEQKIKVMQVLARQNATDYVDRSKVEITKGDIQKDLIVAGNIVGHENYRFEAKVFDQGSEYGINNGRISKLVIWDNGMEVANYSRGWGQKPIDYRDEDAVNQVVAAFPSRVDMTPQQWREAYIEETTREKLPDSVRNRDR